MSDRFQLETEITNLHGIADELDLIAEHAIESEAADDDTVNAIIGLAALTRMRANKLFETFKAAFHLDEYSKNRRRAE